MRTAICSSTAPQGGDGEDRADLPRAVPSVNYAREGTIAITQYLKQAPEIGVTLVRHRADSYRAHGAEARRRPAGALLRCRLHRKYAPPYTRPTRHDQCRDAFYFRGVAISRSVYRRRDPHRDQRANDRDGDATRANEQGSWHLDSDVCFGPEADITSVARNPLWARSGHDAVTSSCPLLILTGLREAIISVSFGQRQKN